MKTAYGSSATATASVHRLLVNSEMKPLGEKVEGVRDLLGATRGMAGSTGHGLAAALKQRDCRVLCKDCISTVN